MKNLLVLAAAGEAIAGLILLVYPPILVKLLFGAPIVGAGVVMSRIAGISLIALGLACWPDRVLCPGAPRNIDLQHARHAVPLLPRPRWPVGRKAVMAGRSLCTRF